ncbi:FMN-dependent NADH-azoreductase [Granulicella arctica]|uniref:FMN dependent NADH:quinone oxidoreductase n=1 Tax=Granulicella arctica TaxID=940613 RepID=A0A7Y9PIM5_9BACT|nr:NAD(P)H-dependent oxidoreductase [Granulicella arctica]NYF80603.1 FMN-dependent NADH-azoreductase [Granulicella arctica]
MSTLLAIEVSPRFSSSVSRKLTATFVEEWKAAHPDGSIIMRDLMKTNLPWIDLSWIGGAFTPPETHSPEMQQAIKISDDLTAELKDADDIVIGTPMYNFSIPANLKSYIDHIVRVGVTVSTTYEGMLKGRKLTIILATGGDFAPGAPYESANAASSYLKQVFGFIGITDVKVVLAGKTLGIERGQTTFEELAKPIEPELIEAARA